ncbi:BTAD domain-containing putative transcriptional regulator [Embleya sp. NPDC050493]|uniref:BTAD domain-containing putative transcriptional regulator n=1 Tax=Embleya sp. NPDC050493 TaxID=3363989 RepID=UPI0037A81F26
MRFGVLGPLAVWGVDGEPLKVPEAGVRALLADLLTYEGRTVSADRLVDDLWGEDPPGRPANALQTRISVLRRTLGRDRVVYQAPGYRLLLERIDAADADLDAHRFAALLELARTQGDPRERSATLARALGLWRGPAYADFADEEFARPAARRLEELRLVAVEEHAGARLEAGEHAALAAELAGPVAQHPLRERLRAVYLRALYRAGRQSEALASYADLRERLADELGLDPGPEIVALHAAILRQDESPRPPAPVAQAADAACGRSDTRGPAAAPEVRLPVPLTPLIGREQAVAELGPLLERTRLVTLTGSGGVGKTRLALEVAGRFAREAAGCVPDGVRLVELAGRGGEMAELAQVVCDVFGVRDDGLGPAAGRSTAERLVAALRDRRVLLVLDNCEHMVEAAAELTDRLLAGAPGLRVLATSREPLALPGETVFQVEPLHRDDAVRLFTERAAASAPGFSPAAAIAPGEIGDLVAEVCLRLDGIPLALELAATRVRALGMAQLAARLDDRFRLLTSGRRGTPARQQTLRAMIDWSWDLLRTRERIVLCRLAVHRDGCTLEAAEAVCAGAGVRQDEVVDLLARLVEKSLVVMVDGAGGTAPRYRLLESVAAYAQERLARTEEADAVRDRHLAYYLDFAERARPRLCDHGQREWLERLDAESANLYAALEAAIRHASADAAPGADQGMGADPARRFAAALAWWWLLRGRPGEARRRLGRILDAVPQASELRLLHDAFTLLTGDRPTSPTDSDAAAVDPAVPAPALWLYAYGLFNGGEVRAAEVANDRALGRADADGDRWGTAAGLALRAMCALIRGDLDAVREDGLRSAALFRAVGDRWGEAQTVQPLAALAEIKGDHAEATRFHREGLRPARELGLAVEVCARLSGLGRLALLEHAWERARELHEQARRAAVEQGFKYGEIHALMGLALGARRSGDLDEAEAHLVHMRDAELSSPAGRHLVEAELGFVDELRGNAAGALAHHLRSLDIARSLAEPRALALSLEGLAGAASLAGTTAAAEQAARLLGASDAARRSVGAPLPAAERIDVDRITGAATATLGPAAFTAAFTRGATSPPETTARSATETLAAVG